MRAHHHGLAFVCAALLCGAVATTHTTPAAAQGHPRPAKPAAGKPTAAKPAAGRSVKQQAKAAFLSGRAKLKAGDFAGALADYQKAESLIPGVKPKYKIAECLDKLNRAEEAVAAYKKFLVEAQLKVKSYDVTNPKQARRKAKIDGLITTANGRIMALEALIPATVTLQLNPPGAPGTQVTVDGAPVQGAVLKLTAGQHTVVVTAQGYQPLTEVVMVKGGEVRTLPLTLMPAMAPPPPPPPPGGEDGAGRSNVPAYVTLGIAGAGAILGTVFGIQALGAKSDFDDAPTSENADSAERSALIADMSFGVALTFGITGAVLLFSGGEDEEMVEAASTMPKLTPMVGTKGGGMGATWVF